MAFRDLDEIASMFSELAGYAKYEQALLERYHRKLGKEKERNHFARNGRDARSAVPRRPRSPRLALTNEQIQERLVRFRERARAAYAALSPEQKRAKLDARAAEYASMTPEEKCGKLAIFRHRSKLAYDRLTPAQKRARQRKQFAYQKARESKLATQNPEKLQELKRKRAELNRRSYVPKPKPAQHWNQRWPSEVRAAIINSPLGPKACADLYGVPEGTCAHLQKLSTPELRATRREAWLERKREVLARLKTTHVMHARGPRLARAA